MCAPVCGSHFLRGKGGSVSGRGIRDLIPRRDKDGRLRCCPLLQSTGKL